MPKVPGGMNNSLEGKGLKDPSSVASTYKSLLGELSLHILDKYQDFLDVLREFPSQQMHIVVSYINATLFCKIEPTLHIQCGM